MYIQTIKFSFSVDQKRKKTITNLNFIVSNNFSDGKSIDIINSIQMSQFYIY